MLKIQKLFVERSVVIAESVCGNPRLFTRVCLSHKTKAAWNKHGEKIFPMQKHRFTS